MKIPKVQVVLTSSIPSWWVSAMEIYRNCFGLLIFLQVAIIHRITAKSHDYLCAGSILTRTWVLTSGTCTTECSIPHYYTVVAGLNDPFKFDPDDERTISSEVVECYQSSTHKKLQDIALMKASCQFWYYSNFNAVTF